MENKPSYDLLYDIIDEACMLLYEQTNANYLDCLIRSLKDILEEFDDSRLDSESIEKLEAIYDKLNDHTFSNEDIRLALNLLIIKGLKHANMPLDMMIPDSIALVFANIIRTFFNDVSYANMLEVNAKTANLTNTIANFLEFETGCFAIEEDSKLAEVARLAANMQDRELVVYNNKLLDPLEVSSDIIIGHLESKQEENAYIPYKIISKMMKNLEEEGIFIFLIDNDFFNYPDLTSFKNAFTGTLLGLLILPETLFKGTITKSILIGSKKQLNDFNMLVVNLPSFSDAVKLNESMIKIENWISEVRALVKE